MPSIIYFFFAVAVLFFGYHIYGRFIERVFGADDSRKTPCYSMADGVDYVEMPTIKVFLIQLLNIAGVGPVFGPILGALYGPWALVWIVVGCLVGGGVQDYFSGMISIRNKGTSMPDIVGDNLGKIVKSFVAIFVIVVVVLVGVIFSSAPASLLASVTPIPMTVWVLIIYAYYFFATILPIDKIIGRVYPIFAVALIIMAVGLTGALIFKGYDFYPSASFVNQHPQELPMWPLMCITIACGAVSGFHATQSPMMARCLKRESLGRPVFYGAMVTEGLIALIWATIGMTFFHSPEILQEALAAGGPGKVVSDVSIALLGPVGGFLALLGVIALPISTGDTAFRAARLILADMLNYQQKSNISRLILTIPLFAAGVMISQAEFTALWRYLGWANQILSVIFFWTIAVYLVRRKAFHWIASIPAMFMTAVCVTYICYEKIGFSLPYWLSCFVGLGVAVAFLALMLYKRTSLEARPTE
ncbi:MAG: carbon starvation CstA family protein [Pseudomonadota bacterium]